MPTFVRASSTLMVNIDHVVLVTVIEGPEDHLQIVLTTVLGTHVMLQGGFAQAARRVLSRRT